MNALNSKSAPRFRAKGVAFAGVLAAVLCTAAADELLNLQRLRSMPIEQRKVLLDRLKRFEDLSYQDREKLRLLDQKILSLDSPERARYLSIVRRYHLLYQNLDESKKKALDETADPAVKLARAIDFAKAPDQDPSSAKPASADKAALQGNQSFPAPLETVHLIKIWLTIDPKERAKLDKLKELSELVPEIRRRGGKVEWLREPEKEDFDWAKKQIASSPLTKDLDATKKQNRTRFLAQHNFMSRFEPDSVVDSDVLFRFGESLPRLFRARLDASSPELARRRLLLWFTLSEANPEDFPAPKKLGEQPKSSGPASGSSPF